MLFSVSVLMDAFIGMKESGYPYWDLTSRPGVGNCNSPNQDLQTYVEPGIEQTGQFNPNTILRTTIAVI